MLVLMIFGTALAIAWLHLFLYIDWLNYGA